MNDHTATHQNDNTLRAATAPPLRLAGVDDDTLTEPHLVRGID